MSSNGWKTNKLRNLCAKIGSGATPRGGKESYLAQGPFALVRSQNVLDFFFSYDGLAYIDEEQANQLSNVELQVGDVLLNITGDSVARVCQVPDEILPARVNQHVSIIRADSSKLIPEYLKYFLLNPQFKNHMLALASVGATRNALTKGMIEDFEIALPPIETQRRIAAILSALDDKIELNRQTNATLQAIAQAIFREWFVDFRFPGATGEMQESELGMIPKGWRVGKLEEICELTKGVSYRSNELKPSNLALVTLKSIKRGGGFNFDGFKEFEGKYKESQVLFEGDVVIAQTDITQNAEVVGSAALVENPFNYQKLIASIDIVKCKPTKDFVSNVALFHFLSQPDFKDYCLSHTNGSTVLHLRSSELPNYQLVIPNEGLLVDFSSVINPIRTKIVDNNREIQTLITARDSLLPVLMSGEVEI